MKVIKNVTAMMLVVATFAFCGLGAYAAKLPILTMLMEERILIHLHLLMRSIVV